MDDTRVLGETGEDGNTATRTVPCRLLVTDDGLCITEVRISIRSDGKLKAFASVTMNNALAIRGIKVIAGRERLFVAMPSRSRPDGSFQDVVHPINQETRKRLEATVLDVYHDVIEGSDIH